MHVHIKPRKGFIPKYFPLQQRGTTTTVQTTLRVSVRSSSKLMPIRDTAKTRGEDRKKAVALPDTASVTGKGTP